jgi:hypothetical protein
MLRPIFALDALDGDVLVVNEFGVLFPLLIETITHQLPCFRSANIHDTIAQFDLLNVGYNV